MSIEKPTKEEIEEGLRLLAKKQDRDQKVKAGILKPSYKKVSEMTPEEAKAYKAANKRYSLKTSILLEKARKAGLTVTDAEVDAAMKKLGPSK